MGPGDTAAQRKLVLLSPAQGCCVRFQERRAPSARTLSPPRGDKKGSGVLPAGSQPAKGGVSEWLPGPFVPFTPSHLALMELGGLKSQAAPRGGLLLPSTWVPSGVGLSRAVGLQPPSSMQQALHWPRLPWSILPAAAPLPLPPATHRQPWPPPKPPRARGRWAPGPGAGRALLPMEEVATPEQSFPSAPYIYCKVFRL